jgi:putative signal transducing protein
MNPDREQLEALFRGMSDEELLQRCGTDLTVLAQEVALAEASRRGLTLAAHAAFDEAQGVEVAPGHGPLCLCARYLNPMDAEILVARLQTEGLAARLMDSDTVYANGALFGSLSLGGVRVMVPESQLQDAMRIRAAFDAGEYAIDEDFDVNQ